MVKLSCFDRLSYETDSQLVMDFIYFSAEGFVLFCFVFLLLLCDLI